MAVSHPLKKNKQFRSSLLTVVLALITVSSILLATFQVMAWFKNFTSASSDAVLTNFETKLEYSTGTDSWEEITKGAGIPVIIQNNAVKLDVTRVNSVSVTPNDLKLRITYKGKSNALIRFSAFGSFYNADTGTYLPQGEGFWKINGTNWQNNDSFWYYKKIVGCKHDETWKVTAFSDNHELDTVTVTIDATKLASVISPHQDYQGDLYIHIDAVQPDRFQAYWGISQLPFTLSE